LVLKKCEKSWESNMTRNVGIEGWLGVGKKPGTGLKGEGREEG